MKLVETAAAMELAGVPRRIWDRGLKHRVYNQAPPTTKGLPRQFDRDDILAMSVQAQLVTLGLSNAAAWKIAGDVRSALRSGGEDIEHLWITCSAAGLPRNVATRRPEGVPSFTVPVAELREKTLALVTARLARGARN